MGRWGSTPWGGGGWGGAALGEGLELVAVDPVAENLIRLTFNRGVRFTGLLDPFDGSDIGHYSVTEDTSTRGSDELPPRPVRPILAELERVEGAGGRLVDVTVDRPLSPYPSRYTCAVNGLRAYSGVPLTIGRTSLVFDGLAMAARDPSRDATAAAGDFANPQTVFGLGSQGSLPPAAALLLGTFPIDSTGDYGIDRGIVSYKKRILRRLTTTLAGFAHLAASRYGVGVTARVKQLARAGVKESLASEAETQIRLEPETAAVKVTIVQGRDPGVTIFQVRARTLAGSDVGMDVPFNGGR